MNPEEQTQASPTWVEAHPWLWPVAVEDEEDSVDEVIRYTLDELRLA